MKQAYKNIQLTKKQKHKIMMQITDTKPPKNKWVPVIGVAFCVVAALFLMLGSQTFQPTQTTTAQSPYVFLQKDVQSIVLYSTVTLLLLIAAYVQLLLLIMNPQQLLRFRLIRYLAERKGTRKIVPFFFSPVVLIFILIMLLFITQNPIYILQFSAVCFLLINAIFIQMRFVKQNIRATCPHCHYSLTNKEIYLNKKCEMCGKGRQKEITNGAREFMATFGGFVYILFPAFQIHWSISVLYLIAYFTFTFFYILPYLARYTKEEDLPKPLW